MKEVVRINRKGKKTGFWILIILISLILLGVIIKTVMEGNLEALAKTKVESFDLSKTENGVYTGDHSVLPVKAKVEVTIQDHVITNLDLIEHFNGQGTGAEVILERVLEEQDIAVDVISGATYSSVVILKAIEDALKQSVAAR